MRRTGKQTYRFYDCTNNKTLVIIRFLQIQNLNSFCYPHFYWIIVSPKLFIYNKTDSQTITFVVNKLLNMGIKESNIRYKFIGNWK